MLERLERFITPDPHSSIWRRLAPFGVVVFAGLVAFAVAGAGWEYTNGSVFCGTACHIHPPQYTSYLASAHANVKCVECHIGRATIATQFTRKAHDITHVIRFIGAHYEQPIYVKGLRPANQICEKCHNPTKFSPNSLREFKHYDAAKNSQITTTYLSFKIGGGTYRDGLGKGIHWHVENKVEYIATDEPEMEQEIPWVRVTFADTGQTEVYRDIETELPADFVEQNSSRLKTVDCITCHNRASHKIQSPASVIDEGMSRGVISPEIPYFKQNALAVMERQYPTLNYANTAIRGLRNYYETNWADYYTAHQQPIAQAIDYLVNSYEDIVFPSMGASWKTHPNNLGHKDWPGCFRCHGGKHVNEQNEPIRVECNLCHTIPVQKPKDGATPFLPMQESYEPPSHVNSDWIARHRFEFDSTCQGCHDVANPGGGDDSSFCANSACHASEWSFAGLNASRIIELTNVLAADLPTYPEAKLTWHDLIGPILDSRCVACHGGTAGLHLDSYAGVLAGGNIGPAIIVGNAEESLLVRLQREGHPNSLSPRELQWIMQWINEGAPEL
jgi:hypothetical protein